MINFNLQCFLDAASELVRADEVERALYLLDNLPAYYRDHKPQEVVRLRNDILARVATPTSYASIEDGWKIDTTDQYNMRESLRGKLLCEDVERLNTAGHVPHIIDFAPGEFWMPAMLRRHELKFTYQAICLSSAFTDACKKEYHTYVRRLPIDEQPIIFCALEIIEHLWSPLDIKAESLRGRQPDIVHLSTPQYSFDYACLDWRTRDLLGHLRAYTPTEFYDIAAKLFSEYEQEFTVSQVMHSRLVLKETKFEIARKSGQA